MLRDIFSFTFAHLCIVKMRGKLFYFIVGVFGQCHA
jgi:hypothetical protein